ncbi:MAG: hypothetical protein AAF530_25395 [Pseudomonadota bacterium]
MNDPLRQDLMQRIQGGWAALCLCAAACRLALAERLEGGPNFLADLIFSRTGLKRWAKGSGTWPG